MNTKKSFDYVIFGNYGDNTLALIQWAYQQKLRNSIAVVSIATGWNSPPWEERVVQGRALATRYGFHTYHLSSKTSFQELASQRQAFPSKKYQWCTYFLKGMTLNAWLDEVDFDANMVVLLPKRRADNRKQIYLAEYIESSEFYGGRKLWHPLFDLDDDEKKQLLLASGFAQLGHRSQECYPCIHSSVEDLKALDPLSIEKVVELEARVQKSMFFGVEGMHSSQNFRDNIRLLESQTPQTHEDYDCDSHWVCGI